MNITIFVPPLPFPRMNCSQSQRHWVFIRLWLRSWTSGMTKTWPLSRMWAMISRIFLIFGLQISGEVPLMWIRLFQPDGLQGIWRHFIPVMLKIRPRNQWHFNKDQLMVYCLQVMKVSPELLWMIRPFSIIW